MKRKYTRRLKRIARPISTANRGVSFKRTWFSTAWPFGTATTDGFWRKFNCTLAQCPNYLEYVALFDEYKITGVKVTFHPRNGMVQAPAQGTGLAINNNQFYITTSTSKRDYGLVPSGTYSSSTYNGMLEELGASARTKPLTKPVSIFYKPTIYSDEGGGVNMKKFPWIQTNIVDVACHGAHAFIHDYNFSNLNAQTMGVDIQYTMYFQCRGQA